MSREEGRPRLDVQAKSSTMQPAEGDEFAFRLKRKNYDDLRITAYVPRYLFVVAMPHEVRRWIEVVPDDETTLFRCVGYWMSLKDYQATNQQSITIRIPKDNLLTPEALTQLMHRIGQEPLL